MLLTLQQCRGSQMPKRPSLEVFLPGKMDFQGGRQQGSIPHQRGVEHRRERFQGVGHTHPIHFDVEIICQVGCEVDVLQTMQEG